MSTGSNPDTNQSPAAISLPDESQGVENTPSSGQDPRTPPQPDEHVPPVEVPGRPETPEHVPEKGGRKRPANLDLIKG